MNPMLLRRARKIIVAEGGGALPLPLAATMQKNLEALGFVMSRALFERVRTLEPAQADALYRKLVAQLKRLVGAHREFRPLYPNFPDQVMRLDDAELYLNALFHYAGLADGFGEKAERPALAEAQALRTIDLGTTDDADALFVALARSKSPYSAEDGEDVRWFVAQYRPRIGALLPETMPCKENAATIVAACLQTGAAGEDALDRHVKTATDVLRVAVALNDGDISLALASKFGKLSRPMRVRMLAWLERAPNRLEDMQRWTGRWLRLGERLHPGDYGVRFPNVWRDFEALRNGFRARGFASQVEAALERDDADAAVSLLRQRPGELARRLDVLARRGHGAMAAQAFAEHADRVSTPVLLQVLTHVRDRGAPRELRTFFPKGQVAKLFAIADIVPPIDEATLQAISDICEGALLRRFATLPPLGACYLDPRLRRYRVPFSQRSASKALRTIVRGSRLPLPECSTLRFFVWWKNGRDRVDIDLSAAMYGKHYRYVDTLAYYNLKNFGAHHSGDIVDAPKGASEFIDVDLERCRRAGVRYIVMSLSSFTSQPYCDLPECFAGWMARREPASGEIYEPATVVDRFDLASDATFCLPVMFDIVANEALWTDIALKQHPRYANNVENNLAGVSLMLRAMDTLAKTDLYTLFELHIRARGTPTTDATRAQTVFSVESGITPFDLSRIAAEFM